MNETAIPVLTWLFVVANAARILAYLPQIMTAWHCPSGARSVSLLTWSYFAFAHLTALLYAKFVLKDAHSTWIFADNLCLTACLVALLLWKRLESRQVLSAWHSSGTGNRQPATSACGWWSGVMSVRFQR